MTTVWRVENKAGIGPYTSTDITVSMWRTRDHYNGGEHPSPWFSRKLVSPLEVSNDS